MQIFQENGIFLPKSSESDIIVYGTGFAGRLLSCYLSLYTDSRLKAIMVSDGCREVDCIEVESKNGKVVIPIIELSEYSGDVGSAFVLMTILDKFDDVMVNLKKLGYTNVFNVRPFIPKFSEEYFSKHPDWTDVGLDSDVLNFKGCLINNPKPFSNTEFLWIIGDNLLPGIFGDYSLAHEGPYEYGNVILNENDVVFDCGANMGVFSCYSAYKKCKVYAFEPSARSLDSLEKNSKLYPGLISIVREGLSDKCGESEFWYSELGCTSDSLLMNHEAYNEYFEKVIIKVNTIDNFVKENGIKKVDFIKADIEGAERYMIQGARETLKNMVPKLSICTYHLKDDKEVLEKMIKEANPDYIIEHKWKKLYAYVPKA